MSYTDFKEVSSPTSGTGTRYGSQDILDIMKIFNGKTVSNRRPKIINPWLWQASQDITEVAEPSNPSTGIQRLWIDSTTHNLTLKNSAGTKTTLGGASSVLTNQSNTYGDYDQIFRSGRLDVRNPADTYSYSITGGAITAARALTLPLITADDTLVSQSLNYNVAFSLSQSANYTTAAARYFPINGNLFAAQSTESLVQATIPYTIRIRRVLAKCAVHSATSNAMTIALRDDSADVGTQLSIANNSTTEADSGAVDVTIASGSKVNWRITTAGTITTLTFAHIVAFGNMY